MYIHDNVDKCWNNVGIVYHKGGKYDKFQVTKYRKGLNCFTYIVWQSMIFFLLTPLHWQSSKSRKHRSSIKRKANLSPLWRAIFRPLFFFSSPLTTNNTYTLILPILWIYMNTNQKHWIHFVLQLNPEWVLCTCLYII